MLDASTALAKKLARLGVRRDVDLLLTLPFRYEDETQLWPVADAVINAMRSPGKAVQIEGIIEHVEARTARARSKRQHLVWLRDATGDVLPLRFFSLYPGQQAALRPNTYLRVFGEIRAGLYGHEMTHPRYRLADPGAPLPETLTPIYPTTAGLAQSALRKLIAQAWSRVALDDPLVPWLEHSRLPDMVRTWSLESALRYVHSPPPDADIKALESREHPAWQRLKFDELLAQQLSLKRAARARRLMKAPVVQSLTENGTLTHRLRRALSFKLTHAQQRAISEIEADLAASHPMQRLLQGDVGSGKTVVAALAICEALDRGWQAAFMAPTEILVEQHDQNLRAWFEPLGVEVLWLSGKQKSRVKLSSQHRVAAGAALVVGTHALIQKTVDFSHLGLVVIDEQHRFGVEQRLSLRKKGHNPHQLMMSATPIPRTLAMSYFADLDVSVLDELPAGRTPIVTKLIAEKRRGEIIAFVREQALQKRQVYWVCPLIEESEKLQLQTATDTYANLRDALPQLKVGLVHGRLSADEKQATMGAFSSGTIDVLVATTVIEVGVDVPNAALMVIEHAERFGLSQLHQLRGRIGRGAGASLCILLYTQPISNTARERLKIIHQHNDGFEIARLDLQLRGPGEFIGSRQSGVPLLRYADLEKDVLLIEAAHMLAPRLLQQAPQLADAHLTRWLGEKEALLKA